MNVPRGTAWVIGLAVVGIAGAVAFAGTGTPAPDAKRVHKNVIIFRSGGSWLGVQIADVDAERARALGLREEQGAEVQSVTPGSPAEEAGIQKGDVIVEYQGDRVEGVSQLTRLVRETPAGRSAEIKVFRDGGTMTLHAKVGERNDIEAPQVHRFKFHKDGDGDGTWEEGDWTFEMPDIEIPEIPDIDLSSLEGLDIPGLLEKHGVRGRPRLGAIVDDVTPQLAEFFGVKQGGGVLVKSVKKGSPGDTAGLKAGDVIVRVEDENVEDVSDLNLALRERRDRAVKVTVVRDRREVSLSVPPLPDTERMAAPKPPTPPPAPRVAPRAPRAPGSQSALRDQVRGDVERAIREARAAQADAWQALRDKQRAREDALRMLRQSGATITIDYDDDEEETPVAPEADEDPVGYDDEDVVEETAPEPEPVEIDLQEVDQEEAAIRRAIQEARRIRIETQHDSAQ